MKARTALMLSASIMLSYACAHTPIEPEDTAAGARMKQAADRYTTCVASEADKHVGNPAGAEDIAVAAHGRCWAEWDAYREATAATYSASAQTPEEKQLAHDRVDAHLRQFERDSRRSVMDSLVERSLKSPK